MQFLNTCFTALILLSITLSGCQKDDNFVVKEEAFSVVTSGFNGSTLDLEIRIDTMTLPTPIQAGMTFNRTDKYSFPATMDSVKLVIKEKETGKLVYEKQVKKRDYSLKIELIYVNGILIKKPVAPDNNPEGIRLVSYLFLPGVSGYSGDIDIAYFKKYEYVENGQLKLEKQEELARITTKPYTFSTFLQAPSFPGGRTEIDGKVYFINPVLMFFKSGTNIPYYEDAGFTMDQNTSLPLPFNVKPQIVGIIEWGTLSKKYIDSYQQVQF